MSNRNIRRNIRKNNNNNNNNNGNNNGNNNNNNNNGNNNTGNNNNNVMENKERAEDFLLNLLTIQNQLKLYHWQTNKYSRHIASGTFVEKILGMIDGIIEAYQGVYGTIYLKSSKKISLSNITDDQVVDFLKEMKKYFKRVAGKIFDRKKDGELFALMDNIYENIDITLYLFKLK